MDIIFFILFVVLLCLLIVIWNTMLVNLDEAAQYKRDALDRLYLSDKPWEDTQ